MLQPEIFDIDKPCYLQAKSLIKRCVRIEFDKLDISTLSTAFRLQISSIL